MEAAEGLEWRTQATHTNDTTLKKQMNTGNTLDRDGQCSGLILEGNILH